MFNVNNYEKLFFNQIGENKRLVTSNLGEDTEKWMLSLPTEEHKWIQSFLRETLFHHKILLAFSTTQHFHSHYLFQKINQKK